MVGCRRPQVQAMARRPHAKTTGSPCQTALVCAIGHGRYALPGEPGYTPFRKRPAKSSQSDMRRFVHALLKPGTGWAASASIRWR